MTEIYILEMSQYYESWIVGACSSWESVTKEVQSLANNSGMKIIEKHTDKMLVLMGSNKERAFINVEKVELK